MGVKNSCLLNSTEIKDTDANLASCKVSFMINDPAQQYLHSVESKGTSKIPH